VRLLLLLLLLLCCMNDLDDRPRPVWLVVVVVLVER
jgi:Flp pilus assembly protein protease CpaA